MSSIYLLLMLLLAEALACRLMVESPEKAAVARKSMDQVEMSEGMLRMKSGVPLFRGVARWANHVCVDCLLYTSPSPRDKRQSRMPSSA